MSDTVTDSRGRVLEIKKPSPLERMRLTRACGTAADIQTYFGQAVAAFFVRSIDGAPQPTPSKVEQVDLMIDRVGDEGISAVVAWLAEQDDALNVDAAKNSAASPSS